MELKLDLVIEGCNDACSESTGEERTSKDYEDPCSAQCKKRSRSSEEACSKQSPCQVSLVKCPQLFFPSMNSESGMLDMGIRTPKFGYDLYYRSVRN